MPTTDRKKNKSKKVVDINQRLISHMLSPIVTGVTQLTKKVERDDDDI